MFTFGLMISYFLGIEHANSYFQQLVFGTAGIWITFLIGTICSKNHSIYFKERMQGALIPHYIFS
jgi:hypothetical protein